MDHGRYAVAGEHSEIDFNAAYILLDADKRPLPEPHLVVGTSKRLEPGGAWCFFSQTNTGKSLTPIPAETVWIQLALVFPEAEDGRQGSPHSGEIVVALGDPWMSASPSPLPKPAQTPSK